MVHRVVLVRLLAIVFLGAATRSAAQEKPKTKAENGTPRPSQIVALLNTVVDMKDFHQPMKLKEVLGLLYDKFEGLGKELPVLIDIDAFHEENPNEDDIRETDVSFPQYPKEMSLAACTSRPLRSKNAKCHFSGPARDYRDHNSEAGERRQPPQGKDLCRLQEASPRRGVRGVLQPDWNQPRDR
jgi:hypothetical protein